MNSQTDAQKTAAAALLNPDLVAVALGNPARWKILKELSAGEPRMVIELARVAGCSPDMTSKHLKILAKAGVVVQVRRLYQLPKHLLPTPGEPIVELGHCLLRLHNVG